MYGEPTDLCDLYLPQESDLCAVDFARLNKDIIFTTLALVSLSLTEVLVKKEKEKEKKKEESIFE